MHSDQSDDDYFSRRSVPAGGVQEFGEFLDKANRTIAQEQRNVPDPFLQVETPPKPFGLHSRKPSCESIATLAEEKSSSPLNKATASVRVSRRARLFQELMMLVKVYRF